MQVLRRDDGDAYAAAMLKIRTGEYEVLFALDYLSVDDHVNAVALFDGGGAGYFAFAQIKFKASGESLLCRFDDAAYVCFGPALETDKANVGAFGHAEDLG